METLTVKFVLTAALNCLYGTFLIISDIFQGIPPDFQKKNKYLCSRSTAKNSDEITLLYITEDILENP